MSLWRLTVHEAHQLLKQREISAVELTRAVLERISQVEDKVKAFLTITDDIALKMAEEADRRIAAGENVTPLTGIPIAIKDNMCTKGIRPTLSTSPTPFPPEPQAKSASPSNTQTPKSKGRRQSAKSKAVSCSSLPQGCVPKLIGKS